MTISSLPLLNNLQAKMGDKINIALVCVREAHPGEHYPQPCNIDEKRRYAQDFKENYLIDFPVIIHGLDGSLHKILDVKPNSAHIIDATGNILFQSLWAGDTKSIQDALEQLANHLAVKRKLSESMLLPFFRGAGFMHDTLNLAGKLLSGLASLLTFLPRQKRGGTSAALLISVFAFFVIVFG